MRKAILSMSLLTFVCLFATAQAPSPSTPPAPSTRPSWAPLLQTLGITKPEQRVSLDLTSQLFATASHWNSLSLWPQGPFAPTFREELSGQASNLGLEGLYLLPRPQGLSDEALFLKMYHRLQDLASLQGLQYWSNSKNGWDTMILEAYRVGAYGNKTSLPTFNVESIPPKATLYSFQKDNKLGEGYYQFHYRFDGAQLTMTTRNMDSLNWGLISLVSPGDFVMVLGIRLTPEYVLLSTVSSAKTLEFFGLERSKDDSFINRMKAFARWFSQGI